MIELLVKINDTPGDNPLRFFDGDVIAVKDSTDAKKDLDSALSTGAITLETYNSYKQLDGSFHYPWGRFDTQKHMVFAVDVVLTEAQKLALVASDFIETGKFDRFGDPVLELKRQRAFKINLDTVQKEAVSGRRVLTVKEKQDIRNSTKRLNVVYDAPIIASDIEQKPEVTR